MLEARHKMKLFYPYRPWENEPDSAAWETDLGYKCRIKRNEITGTLCGYVGIPKEHRLWGLEYADDSQVKFLLRLDLDKISEEVHGGLTYSGEEDADGYWYLGFDTAHADDFSPAIVEMLLGQGRKDIGFFKASDYKTWEFVENEVYLLSKLLEQYR